MTLALILLTAFGCGLLASRLNLPPLVGYLVAGFVLKAQGVESSELLEGVADFGILILLFSIGLKLKLRNLMRAEIWACGSIHLLVVTAFFGAVFYLLGSLGLGPFAAFTPAQALILGFGLSFSSTVFAVKTFESRGDIASLAAITAIGVLIIQDIAAVVFLTASSGKLPSVFAVLLIPAIFVLRPVVIYLLERCGHKELLLLFGIVAAVVLGAASFELVHLKPDLGALFIGVLLAKSGKADELSETLMSVKDLLLIGFFLNIGLSGLPSLATMYTALFFIALLPLKSVLFFFLFSRFRLRVRTSLFSTLALTNYSEFGLIVLLTGVQAGLIHTEWLLSIAMALSISFVISAPLNNSAHRIYKRLKPHLYRFEKPDRLQYESPIDIGKANVIIFGMGRIGTTAYDTLARQAGFYVVGVDYSDTAVERHLKENRCVIRGDVTDSDFLERICTRNIHLAMLTMESHNANMTALRQLKSEGFDGEISVIAKYNDEREALIEQGASCAYDLYQQAGQGYADELLKKYATIPAGKHG